MGIRFNCPSGHKLNVKEFLAGKRGVCPQCGAKFIIPMPNEAAETEAPQPAGVGLSQSVEIGSSSTPSYQVTSASPSVIIPVTEMELANPETESQPAGRGPAVLPPPVLPTSILAGQLPTTVEPAGVAPAPIHSSLRGRSRRNQIVISLLLFALVVFLAGVLIWVLQREANQTPVEKAAVLNRGESRQIFAMADNGFPINAHLRAGALELWT
jgi:hypothetical protein